MPFGNRRDAVSDANVGLGCELGLACDEEGNPERVNDGKNMKVAWRGFGWLTSSPFAR